MDIRFIFNSGKNPKWLYYLNGFMMSIIPEDIYRRRLQKKLESINDRSDFSYIAERVDYYNRMATGNTLPLIAENLNSLHERKEIGSVYYYDALEIMRWFDGKLKWNYLPGDITYIPDIPSILKSRPINGSN